MYGTLRRVPRSILELQNHTSHAKLRSAVNVESAVLFLLIFFLFCYCFGSVYTYTHTHSHFYNGLTSAKREREEKFDSLSDVGGRFYGGK
jgi:hypothetical protein